MNGPDAPLYLGIEIGGTKLQLGLGSGDGRIVALVRREVARDRGAEGILRQIAEEVGPLRERAGVDRLPAVGIGFGGPLDSSRGRTLTSHQIRGWDDFDLAGWVRRSIGVERVAIQNDADTAALGEARFGAGAGFSPVLYVTIGSGIGGGLIVEDRIYRGFGLGALEIGHLWIDSVGAPQTLEDIASGWAIGRAGQRAGNESASGMQPAESIRSPLVATSGEVTCQTVSEAARRGDRRALAILSRAAKAMAHGLAHAVTLLAPRRVILGGGVSLIGEDLWFRPIREELDRRVFPAFLGRFDVVPARLGEEVVIQGALALAREADPDLPTR